MSAEEMHRRMQGHDARGPKAGRLPNQKGVSPVPRGFRMVTPYLVAEDGLALLEFAKQAFRRRREHASGDADGGVHGEVRIGDSIADDGRRHPRARNSPARCSRMRFTFT